MAIGYWLSNTPQLNTFLNSNRSKNSPEWFTSVLGDVDDIGRFDSPDLPPEIDLWRVPLDHLAGRSEQFLSWLSSDEKKRANRFHFERDRARFVVGRGFLRWILGQYLQADPATLGFVYGPAGKPSLAPVHSEPLHFNLSHSEDLAVFAVSADHALGVDVERIRPVPEADCILHRYFPRETAEHWRRLSPEQQPQAFFQSWVQREAIAKRVGCGLGGLDSASGLTSANDKVFQFVPSPGYIGALALSGI